MNVVQRALRTVSSWWSSTGPYVDVGPPHWPVAEGLDGCAGGWLAAASIPAVLRCCALYADQLATLPRSIVRRDPSGAIERDTTSDSARALAATSYLTGKGRCWPARSRETRICACGAMIAAGRPRWNGFRPPGCASRSMTSGGCGIGSRATTRSPRKRNCCRQRTWCTCASAWPPVIASWACRPRACARRAWRWRSMRARCSANS